MITVQFHGRIVEIDGEEVNRLIPVQLCYDADADPLALVMIFTSFGEEIRWTVSVDLFLEAVQSSGGVGIGDIRFQRVTNAIKVCLRSPGGHSDVLYPLYAVQHFTKKINSTDLRMVSQRVGDSVDEAIEAILNG